ncbi:MAG: hypothetical protein ABI430_00895 [Candidatus Taylorbacteria bacterium]
MTIIPAIIPKNFEDLEEHLSQVKGLVPLVQIDVCDGKFVPRESWPYVKGKYSVDFEKILKEDEGMPYWKELDFEVDLMVLNPEAVVSDWISAGASRIIIHVEALKNEISSIFSATQDVVELGIALNPDTPNDAILPYLENIQFVQFMGIAKIGFQGEELDERVYGKIREFKNNHPEILVSVDGGVNLENAKLLKEEGADRLVVGSAIFESENLVETVEEFKKVS